jgi:hypothetical protein
LNLGFHELLLKDDDDEQADVAASSKDGQKQDIYTIYGRLYYSK